MTVAFPSFGKGEILLEQASVDSCPKAIEISVYIRKNYMAAARNKRSCYTSRVSAAMPVFRQVP